MCTCLKTILFTYANTKAVKQSTASNTRVMVQGRGVSWNLFVAVLGTKVRGLLLAQVLRKREAAASAMLAMAAAKAMAAAGWAAAAAMLARAAAKAMAAAG